MGLASWEMEISVQRLTIDGDPSLFLSKVAYTNVSASNELWWVLDYVYLWFRGKGVARTKKIG